MQTSLLVDEGHHLIFPVVALVLDRLVLLALGEQLDRWVSVDIVGLPDALVLRSVGVDEGDDDIRIVLVVRGDLLPDGLESFAVTAPWSGES